MSGYLPSSLRAFEALRWRVLFGTSKALHRASNWFYAKAMKA